MKVSLKTSVAYGLGSLGQNLIYGFVVSYLLLFYTDYFGISAAAVGTLFLVARIWDACNDPFTGYIVDNTRTKWGKFKPYILFAPIAMVITTVLLFLQPDLSVGGKLIYAYITYILFGMAYSILDVPFWAMTSSITDDPKQRTKIVMYTRIFAIIGGIAVSISALPLVKATNNWALVAGIFGFICIVFMLITFFFVKEQNQQIQLSTEKFTVKNAFQLIRTNRPLQLVLISLLVLDLTLNLRGAFSVYYFKYFLNNEGLIPLFTLVSFLPIVIGAILSSFIASKIGKKNATLLGIIGFAASQVFLFFVGKNIILLFTVAGLGTMLLGISTIVLSSMIADCVEYGEWRSGKRGEGTVFSTNTFRSKFADAIGGALGAYSLAIIGYVPNAVQTEMTLGWMQLFFTLIPGLLMILAAIPIYKYTLTEEKFDSILSDIRNRKLTNAS
ncbi:MAG: MFS transporter [Bacillota bacterium]